MIELENEQSAKSTEKDATQDAKLSDLQMSIDALNNAVAEIRAEIPETKTALENRTDSKLSEALETLRAEIGAVSDFIENGFTTAQVLSTHAAVGTLTVRDSLTAEEAEIKTATIADAEIDDALVEKLESGTVKAESVESDLMKAKNIDAEKISMDTFDIESLSAKKAVTEEAEIEKLEAAAAKIARLNCQLVTVDEQGEWREPTATPTNTQLLKITFPRYDGTIRFITEDKEFSFEIIDNTIVTFTQKKFYIFRVEFYGNHTDIFINNLGDSIKYILQRTGDKDFAEPTSEIVDRTGVNQNISELRGCVTSTEITYGDSVRAHVEYVDELSIEGIDNVIYFLNGWSPYVWDSTNMEFYELLRQTEDDENSGIDLSFVRV